MVSNQHTAVHILYVCAVQLWKNLKLVFDDLQLLFITFKKTSCFEISFRRREVLWLRFPGLFFLIQHPPPLGRMLTITHA